MTTVYIDKRLGVLMTDSRVTGVEERNFLGIFPLQPKEHYGITNQKSIYVHDRLFSACGTVTEVDKVLNYLISGDPVVPHHINSCHCVLLSKDYCIHLGTLKGKFFKYLEILDRDYTFFMGSGGQFMVDAAMHEEYNTLQETVIETFKNVCKYDSHTDDNINIYRF